MHNPSRAEYLTARLRDVIEDFHNYVESSKTSNTLAVDTFVGFTAREEAELDKQLAIFSTVLLKLKEVSWDHKSWAEKHNILLEQHHVMGEMIARGLLDPEGRIK